MTNTFSRPQLAEFDQSSVTPFKMLRSMPAELRGIVTNLHDALKEIRSCVFRAGGLVLTDAQVACQAWLDAETLGRMLPDIIQAGFMARDDAGALYSPFLYDKLLRSEARAARKAQADAQWQSMQMTGAVPQGLTRKQITARENGRKGGAPRKGETAEQRDARRARDLAAEQAQRKMPLVGVVAGITAQSNNPNKQPNSVSVIENSVISVPIDLEIESDNNILSSSNSADEPNNPITEKAEFTDAQVNELAVRMLTASGLGDDQIGYAISFSKKYLGRGICPTMIVRAISSHKKKMADNGNFPRYIGVFKAPIERAIVGEEVAQLVSEADPIATPVHEWQRKAQNALARSATIFGTEMSNFGDFGRLQREWPEIAAKHGLPPVERTLEAYEAYFCPQQNTEAA